jgi:ribosome-binding ATPase YchF (GTP1/OBG family)
VSWSALKTKIDFQLWLLTRKLLLVILNLAEGQAAPELAYQRPGVAVIPLQGKLEMDIAQLSPEDAELFMAEYGITELGLLRVIHLSYELLGLQSFFTVGLARAPRRCRCSGIGMCGLSIPIWPKALSGLSSDL